MSEWIPLAVVLAFIALFEFGRREHLRAENTVQDDRNTPTSKHPITPTLGHKRISPENSTEAKQATKNSDSIVAGWTKQTLTPLVNSVLSWIRTPKSPREFFAALIVSNLLLTALFVFLEADFRNFAWKVRNVIQQVQLALYLKLHRDPIATFQTSEKDFMVALLERSYRELSHYSRSEHQWTDYFYHFLFRSYVLVPFSVLYLVPSWVVIAKHKYSQTREDSTPSNHHRISSYPDSNTFRIGSLTALVFLYFVWSMAQKWPEYITNISATTSGETGSANVNGIREKQNLLHPVDPITFLKVHPAADWDVKREANNFIRMKLAFPQIRGRNLRSMYATISRAYETLSGDPIAFAAHWERECPPDDPDRGWAEYLSRDFVTSSMLAVLLFIVASSYFISRLIYKRGTKNAKGKDPDPRVTLVLSGLVCCIAWWSVFRGRNTHCLGDPYADLGLTTGETDLKTIKRAYRKLSLSFYPD